MHRLSLLPLAIYGKVRVLSSPVIKREHWMSSKIIAAVVVAGGVLATTPFYLSGFFAHKAISEQLQQQLKQSGMAATAISIANEASELGLYQSHYAYDVVFNMEHPQLVAFKSEGVPSTLTLRMINDFEHGFLSIEGNSHYSGNLIDLLTEASKKANFTLADDSKPFLTIKTSADFSLSGHYQIKATSNLQAYSAAGVSAEGEAYGLKASPVVMNAVITPETMEGSYLFDTMEFSQGGANVIVNKGSMTFDANTWFSTELNSLLIKEAKSNMSVEDVTIVSDGQTAKVAEKLSFDYDIHSNEQLRGKIATRYRVGKIDMPSIPMSKIDDLDINMVIEGGVKGALAYYDKIQELQANPEDPQLAMALFAELLAEDVNFDITAFKAQTFAGLVDMTADVDMKALDSAEFLQNPMLALANLSYKAGGQIPMDLLAMSGQLPPEAIDNLAQQEMLEIKDGQVHFALDGSGGSVNLNGKPLM